MKPILSTPSPRLRLSRLLIAIATLPLGAASAAEPPAPPDLTQNRDFERKGTYNLGATGMRGWIYLKPTTHFDGLQGRTTGPSRQILVTHVGAKSPADGVMEVDDVILGAGGALFTEDARRSISDAIQEAEKEANQGILKLTRWRAGKVEEVSLKLRVMGTYADTAPYRCAKSKRILEEAAKVLAEEPFQADWRGAVSGLALLATGNPDYLPKVREFAHKLGPPTLKVDERRGLGAWESGYRNIFLCEYYLLTGDKTVLPAIREITLSTARGQGLYGTFGHGFSLRTDDGKLHGSIPPYGPVNQAGLGANLAIVMGKLCGIRDPEIDPAIERASKFFAYFVDKGTIPYGEHEPYAYHDNNGKSAMAAMFYAIQGNKPAEAKFFAKMATAGYKNRECGHTGQGFSYLWGALGANAGGPAAGSAFFKEASSHLDLVRRSDGAFTYDGGEQYGPGKTDDDTYYGKSSYYGLSPTATYVLTYALPLKKLIITGRDPNPSNRLSTGDVEEALSSGRFDLVRLKLTPEQLVAAFDDWSPIARGWAAEELARRPEAKAMIPELIKMAEGDDARMRQGATETLGLLKAAEALHVFVRLLSHEDRWLRYKAAAAIRNMGGQAGPAVPDVLQATAKTAEPLQPINWADPIQLTHGQLAKALFAGPLAGSLKDSDRELLYPAVRAISTNADGMARATLRGYFQHHLTEEDVRALAPDIIEAIKTPSPADRMFANEIRMGGFQVLSKYHFVEAIELGILFAKTQGGHGSEHRTAQITKAISSYGSAAREAIPGLRELIEQFNTEAKENRFPPGKPNQMRIDAIEAAIKSIEAATDHPELLSIKKK